MPSEKEIIIEQRRKLYMLLSVQKNPKRLKSFINQMITEMAEEDVAFVQKQVDEFSEDE